MTDEHGGGTVFSLRVKVADPVFLFAPASPVLPPPTSDPVVHNAPYGPILFKLVSLCSCVNVSLVWGFLLIFLYVWWVRGGGSLFSTLKLGKQGWHLRLATSKPHKVSPRGLLSSFRAFPGDGRGRASLPGLVQNRSFVDFCGSSFFFPGSLASRSEARGAPRVITVTVGQKSGRAAQVDQSCFHHRQSVFLWGT